MNGYLKSFYKPQKCDKCDALYVPDTSVPCTLNTYKPSHCETCTKDMIKQETKQAIQMITDQLKVCTDIDIAIFLTNQLKHLRGILNDK